MKFRTFLRACFWALVIATPLAGAWLASSLAAWSGLNVTGAALVGFLLFPVVPLGWVFLADLRRGNARPHVLSLGDRILWRTLLLNGAFLAVLLWKFPQQSFLALATRGDWMLEGRSGPSVDAARKALVATAGGVEWIYVAAHPNPYARGRRDRPPPPPPPPPPPSPAEPGPTPVASPAVTRLERALPTPFPGPIASATPAPASDAEPSWPMTEALDPLVATVSGANEASIEAIGHYLAAQTSGDPFRRAKAIHDYVADRIAYDFAALDLQSIPDTDALAEPVWRNRKGVCAGYANLFVAIAMAAGMDAVYLVGEVRDTVGGTAPVSHAWNAVKIRETWYLLDATWDAGSADPADGGRTFHKRYRTLYLFTPPSAFGLDHFPDQEGWQLRASPLSRAEFTRQQMTGAAFAADGLVLVAPDRPQVTAAGALEVQVKNPRELSLLVSARHGADPAKDCTVSVGTLTEAHCRFDQPGAWHVSLYGSEHESGMHDYVAGIDVNAAP